ncbi:acyltransferase [Paenibacillus flagellatus]|uniref:acyltransferase n=1 Tax=Paenibacillus flagellatus TaxID=2211139 RepID=UPI0013050E9B|nr:acyltransferase [Paenibacillus flagellatus]
MSKPKLWELDIVRAVAIVAVLLIHGTAASTVALPIGSRSHTLYYAINHMSYFAVQAFILLSGVVLFYSYFDKWSASRVPGFYRKRLQYIFLPYLLWLFFYYLYDQWLNPAVKVHVSFVEFVKLIPWAEIGMGYHLYFMVIIMQLYLLFPIVVTLAKLWRPLGRYLWLFGIVVQGAFVVYRHYSGAAVPHGDRLFITYFALFCIGGSIGMNYERFFAWLNRNVWWVTAAAVGAGYTFLLLSLQEKRGMRFEFWEYELLFNGYPVLVAISFMWIGRHWLAHAPRWAAALSSLGAASFGVYFTHPALLSFYAMRAQVPAGQSGYHLAVWGGIVLILVVPWAVVRALKRFNWSWILFGK